MKRSLLIPLFLLILSPLFSIEVPKEIETDTSWFSLLEFENEGTKARVTDPAFYATGYPTTPYKEAEYLITHQSDVLIARFPARYDYLHRIYGLDVDVMENPKVASFMEKYQGDSISIAFFTPYMGSLASYFGHDVLKINKNSAHEESYIVSFDGDVTSFNHIKGYFDFLVGKMPGSFRIRPFLDVTEKYLLREGRNDVEFVLDLTQEEIDSLLYAIYELQGINVYYSFFNYNCATGLLNLLFSLFPEYRTSSPVLLTPLEAGIMLQETGIVREMTAVDSIVERANSLYGSFSDQEKRLTNQLIQASDREQFIEENLSGIPSRDAIISVAYFKFLLEKENEEDLESIKNAEFTVMKGVDSFYRLTRKISNLSLGGELDKDLGWKASVSYRWMYSDRDEITYSRIFDSKKEAFTFTLSTSSRYYFQLDKFMLIDFASYNKLNRFSSSPSWEFGIGGDNEFPDERFCIYERYGMGITVGSDHLFLSIIPTLMLIDYPISFGVTIHGIFEVVTRPMKIGCEVRQSIAFTGIKPNNKYEMYCIFRMPDESFRLKLGYDFATSKGSAILTYGF